MATQSDFIQWRKYHTNALNYLDNLNLEEYPFHTKVKKLYMQPNATLQALPEPENQGDSIRKKYTPCQGVDSLLIEYIITAVSQTASQIPGNHACLRPPAARIEVPPPPL